MGSAIALNLCGFRGVPRPLLITEFAHKAGVVVDADQAAIAAGFRVAAERRRPARSDGAHDPELSAAEMPGTDLATAQADAWFSRFSRSNGLCVLPIVVLAACA